MRHRAFRIHFRSAARGKVCIAGPVSRFDFESSPRRLPNPFDSRVFFALRRDNFSDKQRERPPLRLEASREDNSFVPRDSA